MLVWTAIVTIASLIFYAVTVVSVGRGRGRFGVVAPAMTGHEDFERLVRIQANTLEWLVIYLPSLWLFSNYVDPRIGSGLGLVWIVGRIVYARAYARAPSTRTAGFLIQGVATIVLMLGALGGAVWSLLARRG